MVTWAWGLTGRGPITTKCIKMVELLPRGPLGVVARLVGMCTRRGGFSTRYGTLNEYRKVLAKKDGHLIHAEFLACLKEWMKQHDENPEQTKLKDKKRLMDVQKTLSTE